MASKGGNVLKSCVRSLTTSRGANHYDVLGITPSATQSDIKAAYYKLSKVHHPDLSGNEESGKKFRAISEAYEVLGNVRLKKLYDKGMLGIRGVHQGYRPEEPTDPMLKFYKSRANRNVAPVDGRTPIYDFDAWSKNHYNEVFERARADRQTAQRRRDRTKHDTEAVRQELFMYTTATIVLVLVILTMQGRANYDTVDIKKASENIEAKKVS